MIPLIHPWTDWQETDEKSEELFKWRWKKDTPEEIKIQYEEWKEYYDEKMKMKF